jgi:hypothetical protein
VRRRAIFVVPEGERPHPRLADARLRISWVIGLLVHPASGAMIDYDVLADGVVVGRIMKAAASPEGSPYAPRNRYLQTVGQRSVDRRSAG